jgi:hypothetical protein
VARKKTLTAPVAFREDLEQFVAGRAVLEFALEALSAAGPSPWSPKKVAGRLERPLQPPFEAAVTRQVAENTLPPSVGVIKVRGKAAVYLKRHPPPEVDLAGRLVRALDAQRRLGPESYPVRLSRLVELAGPPASRGVVDKAQKQEPFAGQVVRLAGTKKDMLVGLADDVAGAAGSPVVLTFLLDACRTAATQAFTPAGLKAKLVKPVQAAFVAALTRQIEADSLPGGVGCLTVSKKPLLFRLEDVWGTRKPAPTPTAPTPTTLPDFAAAFDEAFARLDREGGSHNFVSLVDLRRALPSERSAFDAQLRRLREAGRYTLSAAEGRHGISEEQRAAGVLDEGSLLLFVSRK